MAEVYLGTHEAIGGFQKLVVMKRLSGWQSSDHDAIEALLDEARIAATINHPNIVTTLDIGREGELPYLVLEYLSGEDLRFILHGLHERGDSIPLGIVCRIGASIAAALHQAHNLVLPDGTRRCIVHRDVTPSNIIVCYSGVTKLVDFGVARVVDDVPKTQAGMVKGKFSYLAPEQLSGGTIDGRTDVFQLGIVLWEMVTMNRLFEGASDHERVNAVLNRRIRPPSELNPSVPPFLERAILRALERDPEKRHQTALELETELRDAIVDLGGSGGDHSVGAWVQMAFAERQRWRKELERRTLEEIANRESDVEDMEVEIVPPSGRSSRRLQTNPARETASGFRTSTTGTTLGLAAIEGQSPPPSRGVGRVLVALVVVAIAGGVFWQVSRTSDAPENVAAVAEPSEPTRPQTLPDYDVDIRVAPAHATITVDGEVVARGHYRATFSGDGKTHTVTLAAPDHSTVQRRFHSAATMEIALDQLAKPVAAESAKTAPLATETDDVAADPRTSRQNAGRRTGGRGRAVPTGERATAARPATAPPDAALPPPPTNKKADDLFAPASDNLDPFKQ
jgi:serine/threonine-protein kinase